MKKLNRLLLTSLFWGTLAQAQNVSVPTPTIPADATYARFDYGCRFQGVTQYVQGNENPSPFTMAVTLNGVDDDAYGSQSAIAILGSMDPVTTTASPASMETALPSDLNQTFVVLGHYSGPSTFESHTTNEDLVITINGKAPDGNFSANLKMTFKESQDFDGNLDIQGECYPIQYQSIGAHN